MISPQPSTVLRAHDVERGDVGPTVEGGREVWVETVQVERDMTDGLELRIRWRWSEAIGIEV